MVDRDQVEQSLPLRKCLPPKLERLHKSVFHLLLDVGGQRVAVARLEQCRLCRFRAHFAFTSLARFSGSCIELPFHRATRTNASSVALPYCARMRSAVSCGRVSIGMPRSKPSRTPSVAKINKSPCRSCWVVARRGGSR